MSNDKTLYRFRGSIYVDIFIDTEETKDKAREKAYDQLVSYSDNIPCAYVGGVATLRELKEGGVDI